MNLLALPFDLRFDPALFVSYPGVTALVLLEIVVFFIIGIWHRPLLKRPSSIFALLIFFFYGFPSLLFVRQLKEELPNSLILYVSIHLPVIGLLVWTIVTGRFVKLRELKPPREQVSGLSPSSLTALALLVVLPMAYLARVPFNCTAIYALVHDPYLSSLAREFGIKLVGTSTATYAFGNLVNAVVPFLGAFGMLEIVRARRLNYAVSFTFWPLIIFIGLMLVLIGGAKGLLIPTLVTSSIALFVALDSWWKRLLGALFPIVVLVGFLVGFQMATERGTQAGAKYNFAACASRLERCPQSRILMSSLLEREMSLGLPIEFSKKILSRLDCYCDQSVADKATCDGKEYVYHWKPRDDGYDSGGRAVRILEGTVRRALIVPVQVASWHFGYVSEAGRPGWRAMPFGRRIYGESLNIAELAYQRFGSIYSDGDKTATSTAPTGFFLAYPAYLGWGGLVLSLIIFIGLDAVIFGILRGMTVSQQGIALGLTSTLGMNLMVSDFVTTMISHGGAAAVALLSLFAVDRWRKKGKWRSID